MVYLGVKHQGPIGYFKNMMFPPGLPKPIYLLLAPIEFLSNMFIAPFTHAVRLFANMFAGHMSSRSSAWSASGSCSRS